MIMGRSGAKVLVFPKHVVKTGGFADLTKQGRLMAHLGEEVCPIVYGISKDGIIMERLTEWVPTPSLMAKHLEQSHRLLRQHVWSRPPAHVWPDWKEAVQERIAGTWLSGSGLLNELYPDINECEYALTHGDPTLANTLLNSDGELRLIDPIPARIDIPSLKEVDQAKLIQSAYGWEHTLSPAWPAARGELSALVLHGMSKLHICRVSFWAAYHCWRIASHEQAGSPQYRWAVNHGSMFYRIANEFHL